VGDASVSTTGNHPFFVLRGEGLPTRSRPRDLPPDDPVSTERGRWVEARSLRVGDVLVDRGAGATVTGLSISRAAIEVYNLDVEGSHTYAVHHRGILVHNKASAEPSVEIFRADHPFLFLIRARVDGSILFMGRVSRPAD
jgi:hypothetical protein